MGAIPKSPYEVDILKNGKYRSNESLKKRPFILIARDVSVALAVIVAKAPYIQERGSSILVLLQTPRSNAEKYPQISWTNCLQYKTLRIYNASDLLWISDSEAIET